MGTPTHAGYFELHVNVSDSSSPTQDASKDVALSTYAYTPPVIQFRGPWSETFLDAIEGVPCSSGPQIYTAGSLQHTTSVVSGQLPPGLSLNAYGHVTGTPTASGKFVFTFRASDQYGHTDAVESIAVRSAAPEAVGFAVPAAVKGEPYSAKIASVTEGKAPYRFWWSTTPTSLEDSVFRPRSGRAVD